MYLFLAGTIELNPCYLTILIAQITVRNDWSSLTSSFNVLITQVAIWRFSLVALEAYSVGLHFASVPRWYS